MIGIRDPLRIKIEITHPWGRPVLHLLVYETRVHAVFFTEKRYYSGHLGTPGASGFFLCRLHPGQIWSLVRGHPVLWNCDHAASFEGNQITFLSKKEEIVQVIDFYPESSLPHLISFPEQDIEMSFSDFHDKKGLYYARNRKLYDPESETTLVVDLKQTLFNKPVPEAIFKLEKPPGFTASTKYKER